MEQWNPIPGFPGYEASTEGRVRSLDRWASTASGPRRYKGRVLEPQLRKNGYLAVTARAEGADISAPYYVHRLVAAAWLGPGYGMDVNHKDHDKQHNAVANLEWCSRRRNLRHARTNPEYKARIARQHAEVKALIRPPRPSNYPWSDDEVADMAAMREQGFTCKEVGAMYGLGYKRVHFLVKRYYTRAHVESHPSPVEE